MNGIVGFFAAMLSVVSAWGQTPPANNGPVTVPKPAVRPIKIVVRHADPWFIVQMLRGASVQFPELSTLGIPGLLAPPSNGGLELFKGGKFVVNPTDNSIWFYPDN